MQDEPGHPTGAVQTRPRLLSSFNARAGLNDAERPIETLRDGLLQFKQPALLMGEPGRARPSACWPRPAMPSRCA